MSTMIQYVLYLAILVVLAIPLGAYIKNVMSGEKTFLSKVLTPCENLIYKVMRVDREEQMTWKKYAVSVMIFSGIGLVFLFLLQLLQGVLPGNPQNLSGVKWDLAFNTSASFITNTNWQAYSGESTLSYLTQPLPTCSCSNSRAPKAGPSKRASSPASAFPSKVPIPSCALIPLHPLRKKTFFVFS